MAKYKNFYETIEEADRRLHETVVTYEGEPVRIIGITHHKPDGIFRIYAWPVQHTSHGTTDFPTGIPNYRRMSHELGAYLDHFMTERPNTPLLRKHANSPAFNKFRPFPLGMMNSQGQTVFLERSPERRTQQGLQRNMVDATPVTLDNSVRVTRAYQGAVGGPEFYDCVKAQHPTAKDCLENLLDPNIQNDSVACHRNFAFIRGPMDTLYLAYKTDVVGFVPSNPRPQVELGKRFTYLKEVVQETGQFAEVRVRS